ncbi:DUF4883 family protein [Clostridium manihotivorum]|uniref:Lipoprotein n=1 Tax=Clostridium manihotivorum TaxID=2320868 RepID=A0A3R5QW54_9CLOT|nr:DUF4883 family protein [Clostridium manihotivorum]QAA34031.1 hypothetical protein C1I91_21735 [Clostridium manihotivorum]
MKKLLSLILVLIISSTFIGCSNAQYINLKKKPSNHYYTEEMYKLISTEKFSISAFDTDVYKELHPKEEDDKILLDFVKSLKSTNFINKPDNLPDKPKFKMFIKTSKDKYVINIYDDNIISIFPWDGVFEEDFINMDKVPLAYRLDSFCKYVFNK